MISCFLFHLQNDAFLMKAVSMNTHTPTLTKKSQLSTFPKEIHRNNRRGKNRLIAVNQHVVFVILW